MKILSGNHILVDLTGLLISYCDVVRNDLCVTTCSVANLFAKNAKESCLKLFLGTFWNPWIHRSGREAWSQGGVKWSFTCQIE